MANALFDPGREGFLDGTIDFDTAVIKVILGRGYTWDATDKFVSDLTSLTQVAVSAALTSKTVTNGIADAADITFSAVGAGAACDCLIIVQASAVGGGADVADSAKRVIAYIDTGTGMPVTPNGGDITVAWDSATNKIFKL